MTPLLGVLLSDYPLRRQVLLYILSDYFHVCTPYSITGSQNMNPNTLKTSPMGKCTPLTHPFSYQVGETVLKIQNIRHNTKALDMEVHGKQCSKTCLQGHLNITECVPT